VSRHAKSQALFERACKVIPGGIYGHKQPGFGLPGSAPYYATKSEGARFWDVDGNEYIDFLCGWGPVVLGHAHPAVEAAVREEMAKGTCPDLPGPAMVNLAEHMVDKISVADWAVFAKNGIDVTTWAIRLAREHTNRPKIVVAHGAYHGAAAWCTTHPGGVTEEERSDVLRMTFNDASSLEKLVEANPEQIAGVILTPYHHPTYRPQQLPDDDFWSDVRRICNRAGIVLVLDDIRVGFRLAKAGSHAHFAIDPDLVCYSKALANGHPIAALVGRQKMAAAAERVFMSGTYWFSSAPMVAALTTLQIIERDAVPTKIAVLGERFKSGLLEITHRHGTSGRVTGPPCAPYLTFDEDPDLFLNQELSRELFAHGIYLHPHHHAFISAAHTEADIDKTLEVVDHCLPTAIERAASIKRNWP
jgi:glutamate-1-semialdehyde 2,1-aminomutase